MHYCTSRRARARDAFANAIESLVVLQLSVQKSLVLLQPATFRFRRPTLAGPREASSRSPFAKNIPLTPNFSYRRRRRRRRHTTRPPVSSPASTAAAAARFVSFRARPRQSTPREHPWSLTPIPTRASGLHVALPARDVRCSLLVRLVPRVRQRGLAVVERSPASRGRIEKVGRQIVSESRRGGDARGGRAPGRAGLDAASRRDEKASDRATRRVRSRGDAPARAIAGAGRGGKSRARARAKSKQTTTLRGGGRRRASFAPVEHDVRLRAVDRVVHPTARLLHAEAAPFGLQRTGIAIVSARTRRRKAPEELQKKTPLRRFPDDARCDDGKPRSGTT